MILLGIIIVILVCIGIAKLIDNAEKREEGKKRSRAYPDPLMPIVPLYVDIPNTGYIAAGDPVGSELHFSGFGGGESGGSGAGGSYSESGSSSSSSGSSYSDSGSSYSDSGSSSSDCSSSSSD